MIRAKCTITRRKHTAVLVQYIVNVRSGFAALNLKSWVSHLLKKFVFIAMPQGQTPSSYQEA